MLKSLEEQKDVGHFRLSERLNLHLHRLSFDISSVSVKVFLPLKRELYSLFTFQLSLWLQPLRSLRAAIFVIHFFFDRPIAVHFRYPQLSAATCRPFTIKLKAVYFIPQKCLLAPFKHFIVSDLFIYLFHWTFQPNSLHSRAACSILVPDWSTNSSQTFKTQDKQTVILNVLNSYFIVCSNVSIQDYGQYY